MSWMGHWGQYFCWMSIEAKNSWWFFWFFCVWFVDSKKVWWWGFTSKTWWLGDLYLGFQLFKLMVYSLIWEFASKTMQKMVMVIWAVFFVWWNRGKILVKWWFRGGSDPPPWISLIYFKSIKTFQRLSSRNL